MKRFDLRHLKDDFYGRMVTLIEKQTTVGEVAIFLFEVGDFSSIQKSADQIKEIGHELMNSLKFNEVDWTIVVKKLDAQTQKERQEQFRVAKAEAEAAAAAVVEEEAK
jgi:NADH-quinone oxidoreductase subunit E